jgi:transcriptional regulator with XRE-family HTH domain
VPVVEFALLHKKKHHMVKAVKKATPPPKRGTKGRSNEIDVYVGARVRLRRGLLGMSQEKLGDALGLTFQQVQKYERGTNRIAASRLFALSQILDVPINFFYEGMPPAVAGIRKKASGLSEGAPSAFAADPMASRETVTLLRAYYQISDEKQRRKVLALVRSMGEST